MASKDADDGEEQVSSWPCLTLLNLQKNQIKELSPISSCPNLRYLDLSDNQISVITDDFDGHPALNELDLGINQLAVIAKLAAMPELRRLDLNNNKLKELSGLEGLANLRYLNLKGNLLSGFDEGFPEMENLQELDISSNPFSKIKTLEKLASLENLKILKLEKTTISESGDSDYLFKIISKLVKLEEINNLLVNSSMRQLAIDYTKKKLAEKKRLQKEEEER